MSIGIDLGTCSSLVAINKDGKIKVLQNERGVAVTPSYISYAHSEVVIGDVAKMELVKELGKVIYDVKRIIGKEYKDPTVSEDIKRFSFNVINKNDMPYIKVDHNGKSLELSPQEVSAEVLKHLNKIAMQKLEADMVKPPVVVITIPAHFSESQKNSTEEAAKLAGLKNCHTLKEPIAAALAYSENRMKEEDHKILIYDFGGGTFDVSVVGFRGKIIELICTSGDNHLGGEDITNVIYEYFYKKYKDTTGSEEINGRAKITLRKYCESAKVELSETDEAIVDCPILENNGIDGNITRDTFNEICNGLIKRTISIIENMLDSKKIKKDEIGAIILAGGSSRIPLVKSLLEKEFGNIPVFKTINPDEAIVYGAALYANLIGKTDENLPQINDNIEEIVHPSLQTPQKIKRKVSLSLLSSEEMRENANCIGVGIDLGTSTSLACQLKNGNPHLIPDSSGRNEIDSCVLYVNENENLVGLAAKNKAVNNVKSFIYDIKRIIGRKYNDQIVQNARKNLNYHVDKDNSDNIIVNFLEKDPPFSKTPEQISSDILKYLKENIDKSVNGEKYKVVLTVPANFTDSQRRATQAAADLAGLEVLQLINEPTAAAIAYGLTNNFADKENVIVVYDFGGGTFDVSIIKIEGKNIELLGSDGDDHLGGSDLTDRIFEYFLKKYKEASGLESINAKAAYNLKKHCESAKIELSEAEEAIVDYSILENCGVDNNLTRSKFEELTRDLFARTITILDKTMKDNGISKESINEIALVGGSSKIPYVTTIIKNYLPGVKISKAINPIEAVAQGAAILADDLLRNGENAEIVETSYTYPPVAPSVETSQLLQPPNPFVAPMVAPVVQPPPTVVEPPPSLPEPNPQLNRSFNRSLVIKEKLSHSYGVKVTDGYTNQLRIDFILKKGSVIPCSETKLYIVEPNRDKTKISIYEGEDIEVKKENLLHDFVFSGVTKSPTGTSIDVIFSVNNSGVLVVKGIDKSNPSNVIEVKIDMKKR